MLSHIQNLSQDLKLDLSIIDSALNRYNVVTHSNLESIAEVCADHILTDPDWSLLAGRLLIDAIRLRMRKCSFSRACMRLKQQLHKGYYRFVRMNASALNKIIVPERDYTFNYFSVCTLKQSYLLKRNEDALVMETPQSMYLRIATYLYYPKNETKKLSINDPRMQAIKQVYDSLSTKKYACSSPTVFNAGLKKPQMTACFLLESQDDTNSIIESWKANALISKGCGGIGECLTPLRHAYRPGVKDEQGIIKWLKCKEDILNAFNQGSKRKGSGAMFLSIAHSDVYEFINARDDGPEDMTARKLFYGLMVPDIFMRRVKEDGVWSLFCPNKAKGLFELYGSAFETAYIDYEANGVYRKQVKARELWKHIIILQIKKGMPYIIFSDAANRKSNQKNIGVIKTSNLCCEILEVTNKKEIASCNIASVSLPACVKTDDKGKPYFDFDALANTTKEVVRNLNQAIDRNYYPRKLPQIKYANMKNRPIGIGVQGLADTFALLDIPWVDKLDYNPDHPDTPLEWQLHYKTNKKASRLNKEIAEVMYFAAVSESADLAAKHGYYEAFPGSPASEGKFQFDLWDYTTYHIHHTKEQWEALRYSMKRGMRNSLLMARMPTATSAHIIGNAESFEPFNHLIYTRKVLSGYRTLVNKHLVRDFKDLGVTWTPALVNRLVELGGSIQKLSWEKDIRPIIDSPEFHDIHDRSKSGGIFEYEMEALERARRRFEFLKLKYRTVFEIPQRSIIDLTADASRYVCQTSSMNIHMESPTFRKMNACLFHAWEKGLKTGMYYLRQPSITNPTNFVLSSKTNFVLNNKALASSGNVLSEAKDTNVGVNEVRISPIPASPSLATPIQRPEKRFMKNGVEMVCTEEVCVACST